ncbi:NAD(P)H-binding protein [Promicromonospora thailandica]|uniref:Nucleoside-diphosphate-sugar epimerase n=1 Tax=Promicromonospora thailandica TaxID=765201 RepID=A0A9X2JVK2_9MICO|nr:NAD(P)H-binding protein [Promicromonospora thailandica]MCP2264572.1 Nucleoside-diphosphate-sugar epimerase [Promicromonospora thailandica]BFF20360.1 SDR family oxidoreductase [Promicromonospora thailandica]
MSRVLIFGGHGKVALRLAPLLVERGDVVTSVIRNPDHQDEVAATGAVPLVADVEQLDTAGLADVVQGYDAVVWSAGAGGGNPARTYAVDRDAATRSMDAAGSAGVARYVMVSYLGARTDHGVPEDNSFFAYAEAKAAADEHLRASGLDWTILQPGPLTLEEPTGLIEVADPGEGRVSRADVAAVAAAVLADDRTVRRTIAFGNGATPIAEAVATAPDASAQSE